MNLDATRKGLDLEHVVRDFWTHRPRRSVADKKIAGVASGLGNYYVIDPTLIRVAFVVSTIFGGAGLFFYLLAWLVLPAEGDQASALESLRGRGTSSVTRGWTIGLVVASIMSLSWFWGGIFGQVSGPISAALLLAGLYLLHRNFRPENPAATTEFSNEGPIPVTQTTTEWDPLGASPLSWDLPDPHVTPEPIRVSQPRRPRRRKITPIGIALGLIIGGILAIIAPISGDWFTAAHIIGVVVGVLGLTMIVGAFVNGSRGLVVLTAILAFAGISMTNIAYHRIPFNGMNKAFAPTSIAQVDASYANKTGNMVLDLTKLPDSGSVTTSISDRVGDVTVTVPNNAKVTVTCSSSVGDVDCLGNIVNGPSSKTSTTSNGGGTLEINLTASTQVGNVVVNRG
jgi:phage shock protein PspC (stress-responsive transcriptional regulator)